MPYVTKSYQGYIENGNTVKARKYMGFNNAMYGTEDALHIDTLAEYFYNCVKDIFQTQTELSVTFDDEELSMTFNEVTVYLAAYRA